MELYYTILNIVSDSVEIIIWTAGLGILCKGYFRKRKQIGAVCFVYALTMSLLDFLPIYFGFMWSAALGGLAAFFAMAFLRSEKGKITVEDLPGKVYLTVTFFALSYLSGNIAIRIDTMLYDEIGAGIADSVYTPAQAFRVFYTLDCLTSFVRMLVEGLLVLTTAFLLKRALYQKDGGKAGNFEWRETVILLIPSVVGIVSNLVRKAYESLFISKTGESAYGLSNKIETLWILNYLSILAAIVIELYLFRQVKEKQEDEKSRYLLQNQISHMQAHIAEVERIYAGIRGIRHDFANHLHIAWGLLEQEEYDKAKQYLATLQESVAVYDFSVKTGNPITDVIINEKCREAEQKGILFQSDFFFGWENEINVFDVSILLNNILDNAFEAAYASKESAVTLHSHRKKNAWLITSVNSFDGQLKWGEDGFPESEKEDSSLHGLGLRNVKTVVEKYHGTFSIEQEKNEITVTLMLMLK